MRATFFSQIIPLASVFLPGVLGLGGLPNKIYGVNLGSWFAIFRSPSRARYLHVDWRLVLESWMLPQEWLDMGGQQCSDCSTCIATEL
jgi:hypothetical protein